MARGEARLLPVVVHLLTLMKKYNVSPADLDERFVSRLQGAAGPQCPRVRKEKPNEQENSTCIGAVADCDCCRCQVAMHDRWPRAALSLHQRQWEKQYTNDRRRHPRSNNYGDSYVGGGWVIGGDRYSQRKGQGY